MVNFIKKYWYLLFVTIALFLLWGKYENCHQEQTKRIINYMQTELDTVTADRDRAIKEKKAIGEAYEKEKGKPPVVIEKEKVKIIKVRDTEYVSKKYYDDAVLLAEFWKNEFEKADRAFKKYIAKDNESDQLLTESIYRLNTALQAMRMSRIEPQGAIGIAPYIGYAIYPEPHLSAGICVYYRINYKKIFKAIFGGKE